jgi:hypothetical protein
MDAPREVLGAIEQFPPKRQDTKDNYFDVLQYAHCTQSKD